MAHTYRKWIESLTTSASLLWKDQETAFLDGYALARGDAAQIASAADAEIESLRAQLEEMKVEVACLRSSADEARGLARRILETI